MNPNLPVHRVRAPLVRQAPAGTPLDSESLLLSFSTDHEFVVPRATTPGQ
jgi:hypothetical protein